MKLEQHKRLVKFLPPPQPVLKCEISQNAPPTSSSPSENTAVLLLGVSPRKVLPPISVKTL